METKKPFFMRTKEEIEQILPADSLQREQALKSLEHSFSLYDFDGNHKPHPYEKENLLEVISRREMYVVDNNSPWQSDCKAHLDKAFIISAALSREHPSTKALILDATRSELGNLFAVGCYTNVARIHIDRIDSSFGHVFDMEKLEKASDKSGEAYVKQIAQQKINNEHDKTAIRNHIGLELVFLSALGTTPIKTEFIQSGKASDLPNRDSMHKIISRIQTDIQRRLPTCKHNLKKTKNVVEKCYSKLLLEDRKTRNDFDRSDYDNVFGDMYIVLTAIYLGANILTEDNGLKQMALYAGIKCFKQLPDK
jgi:hypothetical protein